MSFFNPLFLNFLFLNFLFANPHCFRFLIFSFYFWGEFDVKSFLAFLVSGKLDATLSGSF
ncbi:hypothetical protein DDP51_05930 [Helicobacter pylori]|nr:hypothetical protein DDP51_05930 [Helicobacter pylori]